MIRHITVKGDNVTNGAIAYSTLGSACFDIVSTEDIVIPSGDVKAVGTGLFVEQQPGTDDDFAVPELQIRSRSGLALNKGVIVLNAPGIVDEDFCNEIKVLLCNLGDTDFEVKVGDRIAQGAFTFVYRPKNIKVKQNKRSGGFGSTGIKS